MNIFFAFIISNFGICADKILQIDIPVGSQHSTPISGSWSSEKTNSARITGLGNQVKIEATQPGFFILKDAVTTFKINILSQVQWDTLTQLKTWTNTRLGLKTRVHQGQVFLSGRLLNEHDWIGLAEFCLGCEFLSDFKTSTETKDQVTQGLKKILKAKSLKQLPLSFSPTASWTTPEPSPEHSFLAKALGITLTLDPKALPPEPLIETQIMVVEVRKDKVRSLGVKWPNSITSQILPAFQGLGVNNGAITASASLEALEAQGYARTLANPKILCRSGESAEFLAGGEFPLKIKSGSRLEVTWRKYGVILKVQPKADRFGNMRIGLETEISSIDPNRTVEGIPGLISHRVLSHFDLSKTATIVLSGLIRSEESKFVQGLPGLMNIPILGSLFSSEDYRNNRSELMIFVQPRVMDSDSL